MPLRRGFTVVVAFGLAISAYGTAAASVQPTAKPKPSLYVRAPDPRGDLT